MNEKDRDGILSEIQVNSAVTREKVENMDESLKGVESTLEDHEERLSDVESRTARNSYILTGFASTVGAIVASISAKLGNIF